MRSKKISFSVVDLMVVIAILMIVGATIAPHFAKARSVANGRDSVHSAQHSRRAR
jgi:type II secretory pathway pseudopilin PulG